MKQRSTTPVSKSFVAKASLAAAAVLMAVSGPVQIGSVASADSYDDQINVIRQQINSYQGEATRLRGEADTLQSKVNQLNNEASAIQKQIDLNQVRYDQLIAQIAATEKKIKDNQDALGETLANLYVDDDISPLEMIASSKNISEYLDKQEYRNSIRDTLTQKIGEIKQLKSDLDKQKADVEKVLADQKSQREILAGKRAEQQKLLDETKGNEAAYQSLIKKGNDQVNALLQRQAEAARAALGSTNGATGGALQSTDYPWAGAATNYNDNCRYPSGLSGADYWGYCLRQCTSYVAWKLAKDGKSGFSGLGHAYSWWSSFGGISASEVGHGDVIVSPAGGYGHVMYVESVSDGRVYFTDYNGAGGAVSPGQGSMSLSTATNNSSYKVIRF